ncbi:MAG: calcium-binding protein [Pseudomonadota bacterium]
MTYPNLRAVPYPEKGHWMSRMAGALMMGFLFMTSATAQTPATPAQGLTNPTLALNLSGVRDWRPGFQFLDIARMMRPWRALIQGESHASALNWKDLRDQGYLDANGWPKTIPEGFDELWTILQWSGLSGDPDRRIGRYVLTYEGTGTLELNADARIVSRQPGRIVFENREGNSMFLSITRTDPLNSGDYIRNISIVAEDNLDLHAAGVVFNPDWVRLIRDARQLRFMDWGNTNNSEVATWADRSTPHSAHDFSVPVEYMVQLANEVGAEPWFTMPHLADETYIRNFAAYVRDHMDPGLPIRVEYSNEVWNWQFQQAQWTLQKAREEWGVEAQPAYHTKKAVETALIWNDVFGAEAETRLIHVLGAQAVNTWRSGIALRAEAWQTHEPDNFVAPETVFDELSITHYFGGTAMKDAEEQARLLTAIKAPGVDANAFLAERLRDPGYKHSLPDIEVKWREHADLAHQYGLKLTAYEGGQHVHHVGNTGGLSDEDRALLEAFMIDFVRSPEMAELYVDSWRIWSEISDGPFMQFGDMANPSRYGSWGIYENLDSTTPRGEALTALNASETPWWDGAAPNASFRHGVTRRASAEADTMTGQQVIFLDCAGDGDDTIVETPGDDGVHGGAGIDTVLLAEGAAAYRIRPENGGYAVTGPQGDDFYIAVEQVIFANGTPVVLADLPVGADGMLILPEEDASHGTTPDLIRMAATGDLVDAAEATGIRVEAGSRIEAINRWSALGKALGLNMQTDPKPAYFVARTGAEAIVDGQVITPTYWTVNENRLTQDGPPLTDSALTTAQLLGSIAVNAGSVVGSAGDERVFGRETVDVICAGAGNDIVVTRAGDDALYGQEGRDSLIAGDGDDTLVGGTGDDRLSGEAGRDTYVFATGCGQDTVTGFANEDILELQAFVPVAQLLDSIASDTDAGLVLSNGTDTILFEGLTRADLEWMTICCS